MKKVIFLPKVFIDYQIWAFFHVHANSGENIYILIYLIFPRISYTKYDSWSVKDAYDVTGPRDLLSN